MAEASKDIDPCLEELLNQRQSRPSYRRMLSDKFAETDAALPRIRHSRKSDQTCEDLKEGSHQEHWSDGSLSSDESVESDDSRYYSASEEPETLPHGILLNDTSEASGKLSTTDSVRSCEKGRSKKQKKKRRDKEREEVLLALPFQTANATDITGVCLSPVDRKAITQLGMVSSLQALSREVIVRRRNAKLKLYPPGLKSTIEAEQLIATKKATCVSWLEKIAMDYEKKITDLLPSKTKSAQLSKQKEWTLLSLDGRVEGRNKMHVTHFRSNSCIWFFSGYKLYLYTEDRNKIEYTLSLYPNSVVPESGPVERNILGVCDTPHVIGNTALGVLCQLINIYLPSALVKAGGNYLEEEVVERAVVRVKERLMSRCPNLTSWMFAEAIPYVWWSRGNLIRAEKAFLDIAQDEHEIYLDVQRATYFNELGRLYLHFGLSSKATRSFTAAGDLLGNSNLQLQPLYHLQALVLAAAGLDLGVLTINHTRSSLAAWIRVLQSKAGDLFDMSVQAVVESVTCHHSGILWDHQETWLHSAIAWLDEFVQEYPLLEHGLSFLYAMMGKETEATLSYRNYINRFAMAHGSDFYAHLPGQFWSETPDQAVLNSRSNCPWSCVLAEVKLRGKIKPMTAIWRKQLCHYSLEKCRNWRVADWDHKSVFFAEAADGSIKCDVHSLLPPLDPVLFHPLTGSIRFTSEYHQSCMDAPSVGRLRDFPLLVEHVIHQGEDIITRYSEIVSSQHGMSERTNIRNELKWEGPDGKVSKLNLRRVIKEEFLRFTKNEILENAKAYPDLQRISYINKRLDVLEVRAKKDFTLDAESIDLELEMQETQKDRWKKPPIKAREHFNVSLIEFRELDGAVVLLFGAARPKNKPLCPSVFVIVNYASEIKFAQPIIKIMKSGEVFLKSFLEEVFFFYPNNLAAGRDPALPKVFGLELQDVNVRVQFNRVEIRKYIYNLNGEVLFRVDGNDGYLSMINDSLITLDKTTNELRVMDASGQTLTITAPPVVNAIPFYGLMLILTADQLRISNLQDQSLRWKMYNTKLDLSEDGFGLKLDHRNIVNILRTVRLEKGMSELAGPVYRCLIGCGNHVLVIEIPCECQNTDEFHCVLDVEVAGTPTEACFISENAGFIVTATIHHLKDEKFYSENLYQYSYDGHLLSALANLGHGPHGFLPIHHRASPELLKEYPDMPYGEGAWYVYFRDGHGAVMCVRLPQ